MKFSTKGTYGLRAVVELAKRYGEGPVSLSAVAAEQAFANWYLQFAEKRELLGSTHQLLYLCRKN